MIQLSKRGNQIVKALYHAEGPLTSRKIAEKINVSMRTVQYELRDIEDWAMEHNIELQIKPHVGIRLLDKEKAKACLQEIEDTEDEMIPTNEERIQLILLTLLESNVPIRVKDLINMFQVSKTTMLGDLAKVEMYLQEHDISYERGKNGIFITDSEETKRNEILRMVYEDVKKQKLVEYFFHSDFYFMNQKENYNIEKYLGNLVEEIDLNDLKVRICQIQESLRITLSDLAFASLMIHLSLSIKRLKEGHTIAFAKGEEERIQNLKEYAMIEQVMIPLEKKYQIKITKGEMCYLVMHFITSQVTKAEVFQENELCDELVNILFEECQLEYEVDLSLLPELRHNLLVHLQPAILRIKYEVAVHNPILGMVKEQYPSSFLVCRRAAKVFEALCDIHISDDELGYLTTYIELGLNQSGYVRKTHNYRIVVVCSMGIGTSKILTSRLEREFRNVEVVDQISAVDIESYDFQGIDIILSTVDISATVATPMIIINPMLEQEDIQKISDYMLEHGNQDAKVIQFTKILDVIKDTCQVLDDTKLERNLRKILGLKKQAVLGNELLDILKEEFCTCQIEANSWEEAVKLTAQPLIKNHYIKESYLDEIIKNQEKYMHYYLIGDQVSMPHAAPQSGVNKLSFALGTLKKPVKIKAKHKEVEIKIILILAAIDKEQHAKALHEITNILDLEDGVNQLTNPKTSKDLYKKIKELLEVN